VKYFGIVCGMLESKGKYIASLGSSNQKAWGTPIKLLMKHRTQYAKASFIPPFSECSVVRMLLVIVAVRAKHRMRYVRTYIFVIDTNPRASRSKDNASLHTITCWARYVSP
jgi:hypothetical protein